MTRGKPWARLERLKTAQALIQRAIETLEAQEEAPKKTRRKSNPSEFT
jgi:hypothetical protein